MVTQSMCLNLAQFLIVSVLEDHHTLKKIPEQALLQGDAGVHWKRELHPPNPAQVQGSSE